MFYVKHLKRMVNLMSKYTTELRYIIQSGFDLGLRNYPIFDENYRSKLNEKILNHYYMREIGFETAGLFKRYLNVKMEEIMPYYNQMYLSAQIEFNPFETYSTSEEYERSSTGDNTSQDEGENKSLQNDTPMGSLQDPFSENYATTSQKTNATNTSKLQSSETEKYNRKLSGKNDSKSNSQLLMEYRQSFLNIDMLIIEELDELFMQLW